MNASTVVIIALVVGITFLVVRDRRHENRDWEANDLTVPSREGEVRGRPVSDSPAHADIVDILAQNEAHRFDPDVVDWGDER